MVATEMACGQGVGGNRQGSMEEVQTSHTALLLESL